MALRRVRGLAGMAKGSAVAGPAVKTAHTVDLGKLLVPFQRTAEVVATAQVGSDVCKTLALSPFQDTGEFLLNVVNLGLGFARARHGNGYASGREALSK